MSATEGDVDSPIISPVTGLPFRTDPMIEAYKKLIDRNAIRENLRLTVEQRIMKLQHRV